MDSTSVDLKGSEISSAELRDGCLRVEFSCAYLIKTMTGSAEKTRWHQAGTLIIEDAEDVSPLPPGPCLCEGGDIEDNIYTYRDMIPIPCDSRGRVGCSLKIQGETVPLSAQGRSIRLEMQGTPKYIEHIRSSTGATNAG